MNKSLIYNIAYFVGIALVVGYLMWNQFFEKKHIEKDTVEIKIDSSRLKEMEIIKRFDCDTSQLFQQSDFTYKKEKILSRLNKPFLIRVVVVDIYQKNDSIFILTGFCRNKDFAGYDFDFELKKSNSIELPERHFFAICVIKDLKLLKLQTTSLNSEDNTILSAECIYFEKE